MNETRTAVDSINASGFADEAIAEFLQAAEIGEAPDRSEFVRRHSGVRTMLESFFDAYDQMGVTTSTDARKASSFASGQHLGRHHLVRPIGSGAFGTVWLGFDSQLKRPVAIKVPNLHRFSSQRQRDLFLAEARTVAQLEHPNIVPIYDVGETDAGEIFLVSRFVAGNDLATETQIRKFSFAETARCVADIAAALEYAHRRNVIHRDVKPSNILIDAVTRKPYITDFGLARSVDDCQDESVAGTPAYMSPEQVSGKPLDCQSDVFSLGVVLFEMLCGERPFAGENAPALMKSILEDVPPSPRHVNPHVPDGLQTACLKSLSKPLDDRYSSSGELESDLRAFLDPPSDSTQETQRPTADITPKPGWLVPGIAVSGVLTLAVCGWLAVTMLTSEPVQNGTQPLPYLDRQNISDRRIAEQTIEMGGHIDVGLDDNNYEVNTLASIPDGDISLLWVMFDNRQTIDNQFFERLRTLESLEGIDLFSCSFSDAGFATLGEIESLRYVHAPATRVTDAAAASLAALPRLRQLNLTSTKVTDETFRHFEGCDTLQILRLAGSHVTDEGLRYIGTFRNLQELNVSSCRITDDGVKHLSSLSELRTIKLSDTETTGKLFEHLASCPLTRMVIPSCVDARDAERSFLADHPGCRIIRE